MANRKKLIVVVGPTAVGKTAMSIQLAKQFETEIISADSRQFYREMSIGTAKPTEVELSQAKHHFVNSHSIHELFNIGDFEVAALITLDKIYETKEVAILVGGSGMYVNALINGLDKIPEIDLAVRKSLNTQFQEDGIDAIKMKLKQVDPEYFDQVDQYNPQRMIRGLEVFLSTGKKLSTFRSKTKKERPFDVIKIGLNTSREKLYDQINQRVDMMMLSGLLEEVSSLKELSHLNALKTVGYNELFEYLHRTTTLEQAVIAIKQNSRRFAKRQLTWFRKDQEIIWFEPAKINNIIELINSKLTLKH